jgi:hypothetical protein
MRDPRVQVENLRMDGVFTKRVGALGEHALDGRAGDFGNISCAKNTVQRFESAVIGIGDAESNDLRLGVGQRHWDLH